MRVISLPMILLLASTSMLAQANAGTAPTVLTAPPTSQACPVTFYAKRTGGLVVRYAKDGHQEPDGQGLQLTFSRQDAPKIEKTVVTVHGLSAQGGVLPVHTNTNEDISETFILERHAGATSLDTSEIWTHKIGPARWVELTQIDYADGSVWQQSKESKCITEPDLFLLVTASR